MDVRTREIDLVVIKPVSIVVQNIGILAAFWEMPSPMIAEEIAVRNDVYVRLELREESRIDANKECV